MAHDTILQLKFFLHYLNMKMKEKSVWIFDYQIGSSLILDHV